MILKLLLTAVPTIVTGRRPNRDVFAKVSSPGFPITRRLGNRIISSAAAGSARSGRAGKRLLCSAAAGVATSQRAIAATGDVVAGVARSGLIKARRCGKPCGRTRAFSDPPEYKHEVDNESNEPSTIPVPPTDPPELYPYYSNAILKDFDSELPWHSDVAGEKPMSRVRQEAAKDPNYIDFIFPPSRQERGLPPLPSYSPKRTISPDLAEEDHPASSSEKLSDGKIASSSLSPLTAKEMPTSPTTGADDPPTTSEVILCESPAKGSDVSTTEDTSSTFRELSSGEKGFLARTRDIATNTWKCLAACLCDCGDTDDWDETDSVHE